jgi:spore germination protein
MDIHIVVSGDTIESIAMKYGVAPQKILQDNELKASDKLVIGQTIIITYPVSVYTVREGDTLSGIAEANNIPMMQLLRNNPFLSSREYIYPGEALTVSYNNTKGKVTTGGFAYPYINRTVLTKTLPYLTYLSIFNYTVTVQREIISYYDDSEVVQLSKEYGVAPLMLISSISAQGVPDRKAAEAILSDEALQDLYIDLVLDLVKDKGYYGVNLSFQFLNQENQNQYVKLYNKISGIAHQEGIPLYITINPNKTSTGSEINYEKIDYSGFKQEPDGDSIAFLTFDWGYYFGPPAPVGSIQDINNLIEYAVQYIPSKMLSVGIPIIGYDWEVPYAGSFSKASAMSIDNVLALARDIDAVIEFDEISKTPYIRYLEQPAGVQHIIWFLDARTISSLMNLVSEYDLSGTGIWNIMSYYPQMWLVINTQYEIEKIL